MGITTNEFFENIYEVIFSPKTFFKRTDLKISVRLAAGMVAFVALISKLASGVFTGAIHEPVFILSIVWSIIFVLFMWFITALFFEYTAKIFYKDGNFKQILFYTAFAPVPYVFYPFLNLLKNIGNFGYIFASYSEFLLYLWIIILYAFSLRAAYKITLSRSFMLIFLPFIAGFFAIQWMICFFSKIWYIFSI